MQPQKDDRTGENFLQRRYGVSLGRRYVLAVASAALLSVLGCSQISTNNSAFAQPGESNRQESPVEKPRAVPDAKVVTANTRFGFKLFSEILKQDSSKNVFVSPSSVAFALAMTYNGASGSTQQAMAKALELQGLSLEQVNSANAALKSLLENPDPKVQLNIANSLWANKNTTFLPDFIQRNKDFYQAQVTNLDFADPNSSSVINKWVSDNTQGKIDKIVDQIRPEEVLFLVNAIYFKGQWSEQFDKQQTANFPFDLTSGQKQHPMMNQSGKYRYYENDRFQAVSLPYGEDGKVSFYVFLPSKNSNINAFYKNLNAENWDKWMSQFSLREGSIRLPRFTMEYDVTLNNALKALGMAEAFSDSANFSGMGKNLSISDVKHKTFVEVNEEGTEAAAATSVGIQLTSAMPRDEPFQMIVDRPFFCVIRDNKTGTILFMGSILDPKAS